MRLDRKRKLELSAVGIYRSENERQWQGKELVKPTFARTLENSLRPNRLFRKGAIMSGNNLTRNMLLRAS
jgi:hypothetical protein